MRMGAVVMRRASDKAIDEGRKLAANLLEAAEADIEFAARRFTVKGTDRSVDLFAVAARGAVAGIYDETTPLPSFAYGCAVCEVEIDPETGAVEVVRHTNVDDCGRAINPLILHGQAHGGMAAGIGQALLERCVYEAGSGQLQSATLMDYALPRADMLAMFTTEISEVPSTTHPLGLRGGGEGGTTPALGAVANAIADALARSASVELPATPSESGLAIRPKGADFCRPMAKLRLIGNKNFTPLIVARGCCPRAGGVLGCNKFDSDGRLKHENTAYARQGAGASSAGVGGTTLLCRNARNSIRKRLWGRARALFASRGAYRRSFRLQGAARGCRLNKTQLPTGRPTPSRKGYRSRHALWSEVANAGGGGPLLFGRFSIADAFFTPVVMRFRTYGVEVPRPAKEYCAAVESLAAVREWVDAARKEMEFVAADEPYVKK
jgi:hypothetical protein